jgi:hypothetical protein
MKVTYSCIEGGGEVLGVRHDSFPKVVQLGDIWVPAAFTAELRAPDLPGVVTVRVRVDAKRGPLVEEVRLTARTGRSISSQAFHQLPLAKIRDEIMAQAPTYRPLVDEQGQVFGFAGRPAGGAPAAIRAELRRHGYRRVDDHLLREVADVYRAAQQHPTKAVAEKFSVPRPTAARWVLVARQRGYLPRPDRRPPAAATSTARRASRA